MIKEKVKRSSSTLRQRQREKDKSWNEFLGLSLVVLLLLSLAVLLWSNRIEKFRQARIKSLSKINISKPVPIYWIFSTPDGFSVDYPSEWEKVGKGLEPGILFLVMDNSGAQIGVIEDNLASGENLDEILEKRVNNFNQIGPVVILEKNIKDNEGSIEFTVGLSNRPMHSRVEAVLRKELNKIYIVMISVPVDKFGNYKEIIDHVVNSIKIP